MPAETVPVCFMHCHRVLQDCMKAEFVAALPGAKNAPEDKKNTVQAAVKSGFLNMTSLLEAVLLREVIAPMHFKLPLPLACSLSPQSLSLMTKVTTRISGRRLPMMLWLSLRGSPPHSTKHDCEPASASLRINSTKLLHHET